MKYLLLMALVLGSCAAPVFGSEKQDKEVVLLARIPADDRGLYYFLFEHSSFHKEGKQQYQLCENSKDFNLALQQSNEPSFKVKYKYDFPQVDYNLSSSNEYRFLGVSKNIGLSYEFFPWVQQVLKVCGFFNVYAPPIPLHHFLSENDNQKFKQKKDELFSFTRNCFDKKVKFIVKLDSDITETLENIIQEFRDRGWTSSFSFDDIESNQALISQEIIYKDKYEFIIHGAKSYFGDEIVKKEKTREENSRKLQKNLKAFNKKSDLFYSRLKKMFYGSVALCIMYVLYKKFYATAQ